MFLLFLEWRWRQRRQTSVRMECSKKQNIRTDYLQSQILDLVYVFNVCTAIEHCTFSTSAIREKKKKRGKKKRIKEKRDWNLTRRKTTMNRDKGEFTVPSRSIVRLNVEVTIDMANSLWTSMIELISNIIHEGMNISYSNVSRPLYSVH